MPQEELLASITDALQQFKVSNDERFTKIEKHLSLNDTKETEDVDKAPQGFSKERVTLIANAIKLAHETGQEISEEEIIEFSTVPVQLKVLMKTWEANKPTRRSEDNNYGVNFNNETQTNDQPISGMENFELCVTYLAEQLGVSDQIIDTPIALKYEQYDTKVGMF